MPKPTQAEGGGGWVYTGPDVSRDSESILDVFLMSCKADEHPENGRERVGGSDRQNLKLECLVRCDGEERRVSVQG